MPRPGIRSGGYVLTEKAYTFLEERGFLIENEEGDFEIRRGKIPILIEGTKLKRNLIYEIIRGDSVSPESIKAFLTFFGKGEDYSMTSEIDVVDFLHITKEDKSSLSDREIDQIVQVYTAGYKSQTPEVQSAWDSPREFRKWMSVWKAKKAFGRSNQWFVFRRIYQRITSFLFGEIRANADEPVGLFAIWYIVNTSKFLKYSPISDTEKLKIKKRLDIISEKRESVWLGERLISNLLAFNKTNLLFNQKPNNIDKQRKFIDYLIFEVECKSNDSEELALVRLFSEVESNVKKITNSKSQIKNLYFYRLNHKVLIPREDENGKLIGIEHWLYCMPLTSVVQNEFTSGKVSGRSFQNILEVLYAMYYDYFDDKKEREAYQRKTNEFLSKIDFSHSITCKRPYP
jgi:hypothetical protein